MIASEVSIVGLEDIQRRVAQLGIRTKDLRRPSMNIAQSVVLANRQRLDRGVDVNGVPLRSQRSKILGLTPLGGGSGQFGRSLHGDAAADGPEIYSSFIGGGVAYRGDTIVPRMKKYLTIPARARGGAAASKDRAVSAIGNRRGDRAAHYSSKNTFILRRSNGKLMIVQKEAGGALRVLFFLVKKVRYPKNEWAGFSDDDQEKAMVVFGNHLDTFSDEGGR